MSTLDLSASARRVRGLTLTNTKVLLRNTLGVTYAFLVPLSCLGLLFIQDPDDGPAAGMSVVSTVLLMALLFPVYYNVLSAVVTRRDELVLKRLRTGEVRDAEIWISLALPGVVIALVIAVLSQIVTPLLGFRAAVNPLLVLVGMLLACTAFVALAWWTAAWTRNAEAAQLTSAPVLLIGMAGLIRAVLPEKAQDYVLALPGAALDKLVQTAWFGLDAEGSRLSFSDTFAAAGPSLGVLLAWTLAATWLAKRSMHWEPRP
ncbi:MAG: ABC transporter permease [Nocardioides sp.]|jgi:ABC-2 type transport system permease protein